MILKIITNKKGSYILETVISLPIFLISIIVMCSIILMFSCIEDANFIASSELRKTASEAILNDSSNELPNIIESEVKKHAQVKELKLIDYSYRVEKWNQDELIPLKFKMKMEIENPLNLLSKADYDVAVVARAYVGKERELDNMTEAEMMADSSAVYIFPKSGEKYHDKSCTFLTATYKSAILSNDLKKEYSACPLCHSGRANEGDLIYYFPSAGESYHLADCSALQRNFLEIEKRIAVKRGYTPCNKCGG